jgi:two-component sensor histidine kinase
VPLGLIVNELITNAIQHSSSADGSIRVVLQARPRCSV